jgi:hypothetical protein
VKRVLITGMSGTGKSAVIRELAARGYEPHDLDTSECSQWIDIDPSDSLAPARGKDWVWQEDRVRALLHRPRSMPVCVSACAENMGRLFHLTDEIVLLSAPVVTVMERLAARPGVTMIPARMTGVRSAPTRPRPTETPSCRWGTGP